VLIEAEGDQIILERGDTAQAPGCVGERLHELFFNHTDGFEIVKELLSEARLRDPRLGG
jgi:hypothetical protein